MEQYIILVLFGLCIASLSLICALSFRLGRRDKINGKIENSEVISTSIFGLLAIFISFSYSMVVTRYEQRRELTVEEANAISTAYIRSSLLKNVDGLNLKKLYLDYIDSRINFYNHNFSHDDLVKSKKIQDQLLNHLHVVTKEDRGALESAYMYSLTEMFDASNARSFALIKTLPLPIYVIILFIAIAGFAAFNYDRGFKNEAFSWKLFTFIILFSLLFILIYDIDHSTKGLINISQDAMLDLKANL